MAEKNYAPSASTVASVGIGVPVATLVAWIVGTCCSVEMPGEVQAAIGAIVSAAVGYFFAGGRSAHVMETEVVKNDAPTNEND